MNKADYPLPTISPTQIRTYQRCPLAYKHRFVDRWTPSSASPSGLLGHAIHVAIEANFKDKRRTRRDLNTQQMESVFDREWDRGLPPETAPGSAPPEEFEAAREDGYGMIEFYLREVAANINPHLVEHRFRFDLDGVPVPIAGQVDLIEGDGTVVDHKTSINRYPESYLDDDFQLFCYVLGYAFFRLGVRARAGTIPRAALLTEARVDVIVRQPSIELQQIRKRYTDEDLERIAARLKEVAARIGGAEFPAFWQVEERDEAWRTCDFCDFRDRCDDRLAGPDES